MQISNENSEKHIILPGSTDETCAG